MPSEYTALVSALKSLTQGESPDTVTLPVAEDEWYTRPDAVSYGVVSLDFEADAIRAEGLKADAAWEGSVDLFSMARNGAGWVDLITAALTQHCGASWGLNSHQYERETGLFHWEWTFQVWDTAVPAQPAAAEEPENQGTDGDGDG